MPTPSLFEVSEAFAVRGQAVIVTGAAGLIGSAIARAFAVNGARVVLSDQPGDGLNARTEALRADGHDVRAIPADLGLEDDLRRLISGTAEGLGRMDALVNCGAIPQSPPLADETVEHIDRMFTINVRSILLLSQVAAGVMRAQGGGAIVNIASINAFRATFPCPAYAGTKAAVVAMTRELAVELAPAGIRVNSVSPGFIAGLDRDSGWVNRYLREPYRSEVRPAAMKALAENAKLSQPLARAGEPLDVALACLYLCTPAARFITGTDLLVDGGKLQEMPDYEPRVTKRSESSWKRFRESLRALPEDAWLIRPRWL